MKKVNLWSMFWKFFKIGAFTFGGGYAMIPLIEREIVSNGWIDKKKSQIWWQLVNRYQELWR